MDAVTPDHTETGWPSGVQKAQQSREQDPLPLAGSRLAHHHPRPGANKGDAVSDFYDDDNDNESNLVKDLRKQLKDANKRASDLESKVGEFSSRDRARSLAEVLTSKGVNAKVAALIPSDVDGEEAVSKWLDEYGDVFGVKPAPPALEDDDVAQMRGVQDLTSTGGATTPGREAAAEAYLNEANTPEEWRERAKAVQAGQFLDPNA